MRAYVAVVLVLVGLGQTGAFFDMDFFRQLNHGLERINRDHAVHLEGNLRTSLSDLHRDIEPLETVGHDVELLEPEEKADDEVEPFFSGGAGGFFNLFGGPSAGPWWKGPNVCVEREEVDDSQQDSKEDSKQDSIFGSMEWSTCQQTPTRYTCTTKVRTRGVKKTYTVTYQCCHGYARRPGKPHCAQVNLKSLLTTAEDLGSKEFVKLVKSHGLEEKLTTGNWTLFVLKDQVWKDFLEDMERENQVEFFVPGSTARRRRSNSQGTTLKQLVAGHMTRGLHDASQFTNEQVLLSENANSTMRLNVYQNGVTTVNCARLVDVDHYATNGIVHVVDRVVRPATKTLAELVQQDERLDTLKDMLDKAGMIKLLEQPGHMTLFAPTSAAFSKLPSALLARLGGGHSCLKNVLNNHVLSHTVCSTAIDGRMSTYNRDGDVLHLEQKGEEGKLFVEGAEFVVKDLVATNGVIHIIDQVLVPDSAKSVSEMLAAQNLTEFARLLDRAGMMDSLDAMENITVLAVSNKALAGPAVEALVGNPDRLREVLQYHLTKPEVHSCDLSNEQLLKTNDEVKEVRVNIYASRPLFMGMRHRLTVQCARVTSVDLQACGGVVHILDRLLLPPSGNIVHIINTDDKFTTLRSIIKGTDVEKELQKSAPVTFLAPVNDAFQDLKVSDLEKLKTNKTLANEVLQHHIIPETLCCSGISAMSWPFTQRAETMTGDTLSVRRDQRGDVHIGPLSVVECDVMATNGLMHAVDKVMLPRGMSMQGVSFKSPLANRFGNPNLEVLLFGL